MPLFWEIYKSKKGGNKMKKTSVIVVGAAAAVGVVGISFGKKIKTLYQSLNSFKDENLAHTFQHTPEIQPTRKISRGNDVFQFLKEENAALAEGFSYEGGFYPCEKFMQAPNWKTYLCGPA